MDSGLLSNLSLDRTRHGQRKAMPVTAKAPAATASTTTCSYLGDDCEAFENLADVVFVVDGERLPVHSQYLFYHSQVLRVALSEQHFDVEQPLEISNETVKYPVHSIKTFLSHVYLCPKLASVEEACCLLQVADMFDAPKLRRKAAHYLEQCSLDNLIASNTPDVLDMMTMAEQLRMNKFQRLCSSAIAQDYEAISATEHDRFLELSNNVLMGILNAFAVRQRKAQADASKSGWDNSDEENIG